MQDHLFCFTIFFSIVLFIKAHNITIQQVFKERSQGKLFSTWSVTMDGNEITTKLNDEPKQFNEMQLQGKGGSSHQGCVAKIENINHEMLDLGMIY